MALGNANTSAQARGKNKPVIVKRRKEVVLGKSLYTMTIDPAVARDERTACAMLSGNVNTVVYHNGTANDNPDVGSKIYTRPRVNDRYLLEDGSYHVSDGRGGFGSMVISSGVVAQRLNRC